MALPSSGSLSLKSGAGQDRSIALEVTGSVEGTKSLLSLALAAGFTVPFVMTAFRGYSSAPGTTPTLSVVNGVATMSYPPLAGERNKPPVITAVTLSGLPQEGQVLTATVAGRVNGPFTAGSHTYQWYRLSALYEPTVTLLVGATNSTYLVQAGDVGKYLVCRARYGQTSGTNNLSDWMYSEPTAVITVGASNPEDIVHNWEDYLEIENGDSVPADWNTAGISPTLTNLGSRTSGSWTASSTNKPTFSSNMLVFANAHRVAGPGADHPPIFEIWIKGRFTANNGAMIGWGSQTLLGITSGGLFYIRDTTNTFGGLGDLNEHTFRIVLDGSASIFQVDGGTEFIFTENFGAATSMALGQTFSGANAADCEIKRLQRTHDGVLLTTTERDNKWDFELA